MSLEDYQNYALAFAGISKALATWTWFGEKRGVYVTVAGSQGGATGALVDYAGHRVITA